MHTAYTWYSTLQLGSIATWDDMVESFCAKYFHGEEKVIILTLHNNKLSPSKDSLTSFSDSETLLLIVMGNSKNKSLLKFALITCLMSTGPIWRTLILFSLPSCSRKLVRQQYQSDLPLLKNPSQKRKVFLKLSQSLAVNQWWE